MSEGNVKADLEQQIYAYQLIVSGPTGSSWTFTKKFFATQDLVKEAAEADVGMVTSMLQSGKILLHTDKGPRVVMSVGDLFAMLGITNVGATCSQGPLRGKVLLGAKPSIIVPNGRLS